MSQRRVRVEHGLRDVLTDLIANEVRDPRVRAATLLTVAKVELNSDMSVAKVYVSIVGEDADVDGVLEGLNRAAGFLRGPLGRELNLMRAPELRFFHDPGLDVGHQLSLIIREDEQRAKAAGRVAGEAEPRPPEPEAAHEPEPASEPSAAAPPSDGEAQ